MPSYVLIGLCEPLGDEDQAAFDEWFVVFFQYCVMYLIMKQLTFFISYVNR